MSDTVNNAKELLQLVVDYIIPLGLITLSVIICSGFFKWLGNKADKATDWYIATAMRVEENIVKICYFLDKWYVKVATVLLAVVYIFILYYI